MRPGQSLKKRLFDVFTTNLATLGRFVIDFPIPPDTYLCPFCHCKFRRESLTDPEALTIEHSIPESLGGSRETATLTCKACNNEAGRLFDAHLGKKLNADDFLQGISDVSHRVWIEVGAGRTQADLYFDGENRSFKVLFCKHMANAPLAKQAVRAVQEGAGKPGLQFEFQLRFDYLPRNARIGLLRIAFLMMFRHFGYAYALSPGATYIRELILKPDTAAVPETTGIYLGEGREHCNTVGIITNPPEHRGFIVPLRLSTKTRDVYKAVIMPGPNDEDGTIYQRLSQEKQEGKPFSATYSTIRDDLDRIANPDHVMLAHELWSEANAEDVDE
jgi:hypothetical protein